MKRNLAAVLLFALVIMLSVTPTASAGVFISVSFGPPALPVYAQPVCPGPGYFWTPGYWAWNDAAGYYWVPGTWVVAPVGLLWTPGYWGWNTGFYYWHPGYWGPHVGFYGGINYGYGYGGAGFYGGEWRGGSFFYNRSVTNVNVTNVTNVYNKTVIVNNTTVNNVSYNGGRGGIDVRPTREELAAEREPHQAALAAQSRHEQSASQNRQLFASENHGRPQIAATAKAGEFSGRNVIAAKAAGAPYQAPAMSPKEARGPSSPASRPNAGSSPSANEGFHKFGEANNGGANGGGKESVNKGGPDKWNGSVPRPGNTPSEKPAASADKGFQKFGSPANGNRPPQHTSSQSTDESWRSNRPNGSTPHPVNQPSGGFPAGQEQRGHAEARPPSPPPPHQSAPKANAPRPHENPPHESQRHEGKEHPEGKPQR